MKFALALFACFYIPHSTAKAEDPSWLNPAFYSSEGREREVTFKGLFHSTMESLNEVESMTEEQRKLFASNQIEPTMKFLFGPLTNRSLASPQRGVDIQVDWSSAALERGIVTLKYAYHAVWIVDKKAPEQFPLPVAFNSRDLFTPAWKSCTDSAPDHQTEWFYWYFWDPNRPGCDHKEGVQYQTVTVELGAATVNQTASFPEYDKLLKSTGEANREQLTFGFGYVEDPADPNPERDRDSGAMEYQQFVKHVKTLLGSTAVETKIKQGEYRGSRQPAKIIGHRFTLKRNGVNVIINVVAAAGVDQMEIFAKSFAHDHDGFFGWFGHSRVGSGFDAQSFGRIVLGAPDYYSVTPNYQIVYWGGCNSYSYYTLPFFDFKAQAANGADPHGTKGLDIIANGLPSYFTLNADNAGIVLGHLLRWEEKASYQTIVNELEAKANEGGIDVLVAVLGDEDNGQN